MPPQTPPTAPVVELAHQAPKLTVSSGRLKHLCPELYRFSSYISGIGFRFGLVKESPYHDIVQRLATGESAPAVVISESPFLVAAYSPQIDAVAVLWFWHPRVIRKGFAKGTKLLSINSYEKQFDAGLHGDLFPGPERTSNTHSNFVPVIAEFTSDDNERIKVIKRHIDKDAYHRAQALGEAYLKLRPGFARLGPPTTARKPAVNISAMRGWEQHARR